MLNAGNSIVVTTDLSANSKAGVRFALQLAAKNNAELIFLHVHYVLRASSWSDSRYRSYVSQFEEIRLKELTAFLKHIFRTSKIPPPKYSTAVHHSLDVVEGVLESANKRGASLICCSTHGHGAVGKIFGSTTGGLISKSNIPVLCVPSSYRTRPINQVLYTTDMENYQNELKDVVAFAKPLDVPINMVHIAFDYEKPAGKQKTVRKLVDKFKSKIVLNWIKRDTALSLLDCLRIAFEKLKPSVIVFFTNKKETFFQRLFEPANARKYSYEFKVPFLSINKQ